MGGVYGADVDQLRALATQFDRSADRLDADRLSVGNGIRISAWVGPTAVRFRAQWDSDHSRRVHEAAQRLRDAALSLRANADHQARTSAVGVSALRRGGAGSRADASAEESLGPAPERTADYITTLHSMNGGEDGVRIQRVRGDDGVVRFVVYINGTHSASNGLFGIDDNANLITGLPDDTLDYVREMIAEATKDDAEAEVMLVGYSQGGIVAQRLANEGGFNVSTILTVGSPSFTSFNGLNGADIVRLEHLGDPVPALDGEIGVEGWLKARAREQLAEAMGGRDVSYQGGNPLQLVDGDPHQDQADYDWLAKEFDRSTDPVHLVMRDQMARFQGDIVGDAK